MAYTPGDYHKIFTAYGLELSPEDAATIPAGLQYCKVVDGKIVFDWKSMAYSGVGLSQILAAYKLPMEVMIEEVECVDSDGDTVCDEVDVCNDTPKGVMVDERGCWVLEQTYLFDFDKSEVKPEFYPLLDQIAGIMNDNPTMTLQLEGNTDSIGTEAYNQGLSERRANAIKNALVERNGISPERMNAVGYGELNPIATNETAEGRALNRRVELKPVW
jgi:OOP family OmpA-OmpF porin